MKFTCEKYLLSLAVATAGRAAASKSPIPAMEGLLIEAGHNVRVTGYDLEGKAMENGGIIHLLNSGAACLDACGECTDENGNAVMKRWWEVDDADIQKMTDATVWCEAGFDNFRGGGFSSQCSTGSPHSSSWSRITLSSRQ